MSSASEHDDLKHAAKQFEEGITLGKALTRQNKKSRNAFYSMSEAAINLVFCDLKLEDLDSAKRTDDDVLSRLMPEFETRESDTPSDRMLEAGFAFDVYKSPESFKKNLLP
jgi:hypothetical protein